MRYAMLPTLLSVLLCAGCFAPRPDPPPLRCPEIQPLPPWALEELCRLSGIMVPPCASASPSTPG